MKFQSTPLFSLLAGFAVSVLLLSGCSSSVTSSDLAASRVSAEKSMQKLNDTPVRRVSYKAGGASAAMSDLISAQDVLDVNVFKVPDLSEKELTVEADGTVSLPLVGTVKVAGMTISQAEKDITRRLTRYMHDPKVSIKRTSKALDKRVTVEGEVRTPGVFPIKGNLSFLQAIAMSQGVSEIADTRRVLLFRNGSQHEVNLDLIRLGRLSDPLLRDDDRIVVLKDRSKAIEKKVIDYIPAVVSPFSLLN